ncbi:hypothetical protein V8C37DRAFT_377272 [Trichoderma ceciliae]
MLTRCYSKSEPEAMTDLNSRLEGLPQRRSTNSSPLKAFKNLRDNHQARRIIQSSFSNITSWPSLRHSGATRQRNPRTAESTTPKPPFYKLLPTESQSPGLISSHRRNAKATANHVDEVFRACSISEMRQFFAERFRKLLRERGCSSSLSASPAREVAK